MSKPHRATHPHALDAIRAARNLQSWGLYACTRYCRRRGVPLSLFYLAMRLHEESLA